MHIAPLRDSIVIYISFNNNCEPMKTSFFRVFTMHWIVKRRINFQLAHTRMNKDIPNVTDNVFFNYTVTSGLIFISSP